MSFKKHIYTIVFLLVYLQVPAQEQFMTGSSERLPVHTFPDSSTRRLSDIEELALHGLGAKTDSMAHRYIAILSRSAVTGRHDSTAYALTQLSWANHIWGRYDTSISLLRIAWLYNQTNPTPEVTAMIYHILASHYNAEGSNDRAVYFNYKALDVIGQQEVKDYKLVTRIYSLTAHSLLKAGQDSQAQYYLSYAIRLVETQRDSAFLALYYNNMGHVYGHIGNNERALYYLTAAYDLSSRIHTHRTQILSASNLATIYGRIGNLQQAIFYGHRALELSTTYDSPREAVNAAYALGNVYLRTKNFRAAIDHLLPAITRAKEIGLYENISQAYLAIAYAYRMTGSYAQAFNYIDEYLIAADSAANERFTRLAYKMEHRYITARKNKEIAEKQLEIVHQRSLLRQKNIWIGSGILISGLLALLLYSLYRNSRQKQKTISEQLTVLRQSQELNQLHATIEGEEKERTRLAHELHDGIMVQFSAIKMELSMLPNVHHTLEETPEYRRILQSLDNATQELRNVSHHLMPDILLRNGLTEALIYFCGNLQTSSGIAINAQLPEVLPDMPDDFRLFVYRTIQELLQNVVKHAQATEAIVQMSIFENMLSITVEDNGTGLPVSAINPRGGIGLASIRSRVAAMQGHMDLSGDNHGTTVCIELNIPG